MISSPLMNSLAPHLAASRHPYLGLNVVAIPTRSRIDLLKPLVGALLDDPDLDLLLILDNGHRPEARDWINDQPPPVHRVNCPTVGLYTMWNRALDMASKEPGEFIRRRLAPTNLILMNDDVIMHEPFVRKAVEPLRLGEHEVATMFDPQIRYPVIAPTLVAEMYRAGETTPVRRVDFTTGWCFSIRAETDLRFDEQFDWWMGDRDLFLRAGELGTFEANLEHLCEGTAALGAHFDRTHQARLLDVRRFTKKWS